MGLLRPTQRRVAWKRGHRTCEAEDSEASEASILRLFRTAMQQCSNAAMRGQMIRGLRGFRQTPGVVLMVTMVPT